MRKLSKEAKFNLKNGFGSLISNRCVIEAGKSMPWWSAIIVGLLAAFLPIIPVMTGILNTNGNAIVSSTKYSFDRDFANSLISYHNNNYILNIDEQTKESALYKNAVSEENRVDVQGELELYSFINQNNEYSIRTFYICDYGLININDRYNNILSQQYAVGTTNVMKDGDPAGTKYYKPTILVFYNTGLSLSLFKYETTTSAGTFAGDYNEVSFTRTSGRDLFAELAKVDNVAIPATVAENTPEYIAGVLNNLKTFFNESYATIKGRTLLYSTTIYYAIYVGLIMFLGLLLFILTRGKRNFNNYLKWYQCMCISAWASITPGILGLILGFLMQSYAMMFFILFMGVRVMWMSMKQLSPSYQAAQ